MIEHVVYSYDKAQGTPWAYRSFPTSCYGLGETLDEARADYASALGFAYEGSGDAAREVREYVELKDPRGFWLRVALDGLLDARKLAARRFSAVTAHNGMRPGQLEGFGLAGTGDPVVVMCVPGDKLRWVAEQVDGDETLIVAVVLVNRRIGEEMAWFTPFRTVGDASEASEVLTVDSTVFNLMEECGWYEQAAMVESLAVRGVPESVVDIDEALHGV